MQNLNSELRSQNSEIQNQLDELQIHNSELENQINDLQNQNSELQNLISEQEAQLSKFTNRVNITGFSTSGFSPVGALLIQSKANVTIQNLGVNDVEGLTLIINCSAAENLAQTYSLDVLLSGEKREISGSVYWTLGQSVKVTVTLKLGDIVLDEYVRH